MQFSCESCHATLHIGDDKVKGKRLVVRCKRCGARIHIADPALGPAAANAAPLATAAVLSPVAKAAPKAAPAPAHEELRPVVTDAERDSDTEDTRAMESSVLEKALQASKRDDLSAVGLSPVQARPAPVARPPAKPAPSAPLHAAAPALRDPPVWCAMVGGKQTGPMSRAEMALKTSTNGITGRTYVWKEGMAGWLRGAEVPELASLFAPAPVKPAPAAKLAPVASRPPPAAPKPAPAKGEQKQLRDFSTEEFDNLKIDDGAARVVGDFSTQDFGSLSLGGGEEISLSLDREPPAHRPGVAVAPNPAASAAVRASGPGRSGARPSIPVVPLAAVTPAPGAASSAPAISAEGLAPVGQAAPEEEERTNVEALPLGERVHQEGVAQELFSSGEGGGVSAMDLAKWASSELGKKPASMPSIKKPGPPLLTPPGDQAAAAARVAGPSARAAAPALPKPDPFAGVPDAPGLVLPNPVETTGKVLASSGVHKSRAPLIAAVVAGAVVVIAVLGWALLGGGDKPEAPVPAETLRPSVGGDGDTSVGQLAAKPDAPAPAPASAPGGKAAKAAKAAAGGSEKAADKPSSEKQAEKLTQEQAEALKGLDNERGVGNHGPKAAAAEPSAPEPAKAGTALTPQDIRKKLVENKGALQSCIDDALKKEAGLRVGKIHISTTIAPSGQVTSTKIDKPNVDDSPLGACLKRATKRIVFPAFDGDAFEVDIPIQVTAGE